MTLIDDRGQTNKRHYPDSTAMSSLKDIGERQLIKNIKRVLRPATGIKGTDDDAAMLDDDTAVCSDIVTFERHKPKGMTFEQFGWTAAAVNFSDLAAMGARPAGLIVSLALPEDMDEADVYDIMSGIPGSERVSIRVFSATASALSIGGSVSAGSARRHSSSCIISFIS